MGSVWSRTSAEWRKGKAGAAEINHSVLNKSSISRDVLNLATEAIFNYLKLEGEWCSILLLNYRNPQCTVKRKLNFQF